MQFLLVSGCMSLSCVNLEYLFSPKKHFVSGSANAVPMCYEECISGSYQDVTPREGANLGIYRSPFLN